MPVPRECDKAFFAPLTLLRLRPETSVFLGLVHHEDGVEGARRRIAAASGALQHFGVAAECGLGRLDPALVPNLLDLHREVAELG
jgi:hypothetical protein